MPGSILIFREDAQDGAIIAEYEEEEDSVRDYAQQAAMDTYGEDGMNSPSSPQEPQFLMDIPLDDMPADPMADTIDLPADGYIVFLGETGGSVKVFG